MFLLKVLPMFYPQKIKNAVTYSVTTFCEKLYALCLVVPPGIEPIVPFCIGIIEYNVTYLLSSV